MAEPFKLQQKGWSPDLNLAAYRCINPDYRLTVFTRDDIPDETQRIQYPIMLKARHSVIQPEIYIQSPTETEIQFPPGISDKNLMDFIQYLEQIPDTVRQAKQLINQIQKGTFNHDNIHLGPSNC